MKYLLALGVAAGFAVPAFSQAVDFTALDADQNGSVSLEELQAVMPDLTEETFNAADADGSGDLSQEEFAMVTGG